MNAPVLDPGEVLEHLDESTIGSCSCMTTTPDIAYHKATCRYRIFREAAAVIRRLMQGSEP